MPTSSVLVVNERHNYSVALKNENWWWSRTQVESTSACMKQLYNTLPFKRLYIVWHTVYRNFCHIMYFGLLILKKRLEDCFVSLTSSWNYFNLRKIPRKIPPCTVFISAELIYMNSAGHPNCSLLKPSHDVWFRHWYYLDLIILQTQVYYVYYVCIWK